MVMTAGFRRGFTQSRFGAAALLLATALVPASAGTSFAAEGFGSHRFEQSNWAGYAATGKFTSVTGSWVEPDVTCNSSKDLFAPWVGIDGYDSNTVEQAGVQTDCSSGSPVMTAWYEMYPAAPVYWSDPVAAGDTISASIVNHGNDQYTLTLADHTKGWSHTVNQTLQAANSSAEAVIESPTSSYPSFNGVSFSGVTFNGQPVADENAIDLESGGYGPTGLSGSSFSVTSGAGGSGQAAGNAGTGQAGTSLRHGSPTGLGQTALTSHRRHAARTGRGWFLF